MSEKELSLQDIHQESVGLLKKLIEICDLLQIDYFMAYGSLLGVVRHQGFIPWDDDTDVIMLRPAYDKFKKYCLENAQQLLPYKLMGWENTPDYPFTLWRFCDTRYRMESWDYSSAGMGLFVDIYCYDGAGNEQIPHNHPLRKKYTKLIKFAQLAQNPKFSPSTKGFLGNLVKFPAYLLAKIVGHRFFLKQLETFKNAFSYEESTLLNSMVWDLSINSREKSWYEEYTLLPLNDIMVKVPKDYDTVLRCSYGDYMQLPPEDKRTPSHGYRLYRKPEYFDENGKLKET